MLCFPEASGLNCSNYYYLESLQKDGIKFYAEPSNDAGTAMGAPMLDSL